MKFSPKIAIAFCVFCSLLVDTVAPSAFAAPLTEKSSSEKKPRISSGGEWSDPEKHQRRLTQKVAQNFKTWSPAEVDKFLKNEENFSLLASWGLISSLQEDEEAYKDFKIFTKKAATRRFLAEFSGDSEWIEGYLYTAIPKNTAFALKLLKAFSDKDPEIKTEPTIKKIATGVVGEFSRRDWVDDEFEPDRELARKNGPTRIYKRFKFYAESWKEKRLNVLFDKLDYWDMRIVVGVTGRTNDKYFGSEESLRWGQDNVKLPEAGYASGRDIFQMPYRLWNKVGDSVHHSDYFAPFRDWYKRNQLKTAREVGCVCGGVSHYGASAACANGIAGTTMGEPGHCAFAVRVGGKWRDNNSISWQRSLHWRLWDEPSWTFLHLTQALYENKKETPQSFRIAMLARIAANVPKPKAEVVLSLYDYALEVQPLNFPVWREYLNYAKEQKCEKAFWEKAQKKIIATFVPAFPEVAAITFCKHLYPNLLPLLEKDDEKIALFANFWNKIDTFGPARWDLEPVWEYEIKTLGEGVTPTAHISFRRGYDPKKPNIPGNDPAKQRYKEKVGAILATKKGYMPHFENWKKGAERK